MSLKPLTGHRRALPLIVALAGLLSLGGCSLFRHGRGESPGPTIGQGSGATGDPAAVAEAQTVTSNLPEVEGETETTTIIPDASATLSATAPKSYTVQRGDTLWGLAGLFLKDPYFWPEIWYLNPEVANPHRIYPGDTLRLATGASGQPQLQLTRGPSAGTRLQPLLRSTPLEGPIANIPYAAIAAFLSRPGVLDKSEVKAAPYVLALRDNHMIAGTGDGIYVKKLQAAVGERFNVMHVAERLKNPDDGEVYGYLAEFNGVAQVQTAGDPARAQLTESARETLAGDVLLPETASTVGDFLPHAPAKAIDGRILAVVNGVLLAGQYQIVAISGGTREGLEPGHVLHVDEALKRTRDRCARIQGNSTCMHFRDTELPIESAGTLLVFRTFERMSYALVASETNPMHVGDHVVTP
jgi:hypothetical protein